jgi:hypothetical protein
VFSNILMHCMNTMLDIGRFQVCLMCTVSIVEYKRGWNPTQFGLLELSEFQSTGFLVEPTEQDRVFIFT